MNKDDYKKLSELLSFLVDAIKKDEKGIEKHLEEMQHVSKKIGGRVLDEYLKVEEKILKFLKSEIGKEEVIEECVRLQNELWEL